MSHMQRHRHSHRGQRWLLWMLPWLLLLTGCQQGGDVTETYGRRRGLGARSVNGVGVLANMFEQAGFRVSSWRRLSPKLDKEQVIVWAPDDFRAPDQETIDYLETWLSKEADRTLVYIGRDHNSAIDFWTQVMKTASAEQRIELRRKVAQLKSEHLYRRQEAITNDPESFNSDWFQLEPRGQSTIDADTFSGSWSDGIESDSVSVSLPSKLQFPDTDELPTWEVRPLLSSEEGVLAAELRRTYWRNSKIIVVANGSWLLNLPLVNPEHRVLASMLIEDCGPPSRACFLESGPTGLRISESDSNLPLMLRAFTVWPVSAILLHLTVLGIIFCFAIFPIFGRPRQLEPDAVSDFGKHVSAVGELLERGADDIYARHRLKAYHDLQQSKHSSE